MKESFRDGRDAWIRHARDTSAPKFITGLRGIGKTTLLRQIHGQILAEGCPPENVLFLDTEDPSLRKFATHVQMLGHILGSLPQQGKSYVFIREAAELPSPEIVVGTLVATSRLEIYATSSSRRLLDQGLRGYFAGRILNLHLLPEERKNPYDTAEARTRWNDILLYDILSPNRIAELTLLNRLTGWLSDNLGDALSLRLLSSAISPAARVLSPHTISSYLDALEDAHLIEKAMRWDIVEDAPQKTNYRYFFCDPWLRLAHFGPAPEGEERRMALNCAWLHLRHVADQVFVASSSKGIDFVTNTQGRMTYWKVLPTGKLQKVQLG